METCVIDFLQPGRISFAGKTEKTEHVEKNLNPQWDKVAIKNSTFFRVPY